MLSVCDGVPLTSGTYAAGERVASGCGLPGGSSPWLIAPGQLTEATHLGGLLNQMKSPSSAAPVPSEFPIVPRSAPGAAAATPGRGRDFHLPSFAIGVVNLGFADVRDVPMVISAQD